MMYSDVFLVFLGLLVFPIERSNAFSTVFTSISRTKRTSLNSEILKSSKCSSIQPMCPHLNPKSEDIDVLECIHLSDQPNSVDQLTPDCRSLVWTVARNLLDYKNMQALLEPRCRADLLNLICPGSSRPGQLLKCLTDNIPSLASKDCADFILRISFLTFLDPRAMNLYIDGCSADVAKFGCSPNGGSERESLTCLQKHLPRVTAQCRAQVLRLSEIQAENVKLDRPLYISCADERRQFCKEVKIGSGQVYDCLFEHRHDAGFSKKCLQELSRHEELIAQDYQISRGLVKACREDIKFNRCRKLVSDVKEIRLAQILLCLENATHLGIQIRNQKCKEEMLAHRRMLLEDYSLSPEIVAKCSKDISKLCSRVEFGEKTIHCLMEHARARRRDRISAQCQFELGNLLTETDVGSSWKADPIIWKSCQSVANVACRDLLNDETKVMNCLLDKIGTLMMTQDCEKSLHQVQYFLARDYKLDPLLYKACHEPAAKYCNAKTVWASARSDLPLKKKQMFVLPCLYSITDKLNASCVVELKRVMRQRAEDVDLHPNVEAACLDDLVKFCSLKTGKGEEILCLQDNMERLTPSCSVAIYNFTELQAVFIELNPVITANCKEVIEELCRPDENKEKGVMDCLIEKKNDPLMKIHLKCRASIEHHQLISLKDYHFTFKFKEACKVHVSRFCPNAKEKNEVVKCLSEVIRNDTLLDQKQHVPKDCHQQLRNQLLQQRESVDLNPKIKFDCSIEITKFCGNVSNKNGKILECLITNKAKLEDRCKRRIFLLEKQELADSFTDYTLLTACKSMLSKYCPNLTSSDQPLHCLKKYKYFEDFDFNCRDIVVKRMIEQTADYRFDPNLQKYCKTDISEFCSNVLSSQREDKELEGKVLKCLKKHFREGNLKPRCEHEVVNILKEAALNYKLNPLLARVCKNEIETLCPNENEKIDKGGVEECLKEALSNGQIVGNDLCKGEIIELLYEAKADIHADPLLYKACVKDINKLCSHVDKGAGRVLDCLISEYQNPKSLGFSQWQCKKLLKDRIEMYKIAGPQRRVENLSELYGTVSHSPARRYFMLVALSAIGMVFMSGLFCGRVMRRSISSKKK